MTSDTPIYPGVGACLFVVRNGKLLLGKRIHENGYGNGAWQLPGGKIDWMEKADAGVKREALEESGITVNAVQFVGYSDDFFPVAKKHYVTLYFLSTDFTGEPSVQEKHKCSQWDWFDLDNLPTEIFCDWKHLLPKLKTLLSSI